MNVYCVMVLNGVMAISHGEVAGTYPNYYLDHCDEQFFSTNSIVGIEVPGENLRVHIDEGFGFLQRVCSGQVTMGALVKAGARVPVYLPPCIEQPKPLEDCKSKEACS